MKRTTLFAAVASTTLGVFTTMVMANTHDPDFSALDTNGNGEVTLQEMQASVLVRFGTADTDGDGFLTAAELEAHAKNLAAKRSQRMLKRMDVNADGKLSPSEMQGRRDPARIFDRMDADSSGALSKQEFEQAQAKIKRYRKSRLLKN